MRASEYSCKTRFRRAVKEATASDGLPEQVLRKYRYYHTSANQTTVPPSEAVVLKVVPTQTGSYLVEVDNGATVADNEVGVLGDATVQLTR